jgi:hypothetical protein
MRAVQAPQRFIVRHPEEIDLKNIEDSLWFLDLVTGGKIGTPWRTQ